MKFNTFLKSLALIFIMTISQIHSRELALSSARRPTRADFKKKRTGNHSSLYKTKSKTKTNPVGIVFSTAMTITKGVADLISKSYYEKSIEQLTLAKKDLLREEATQNYINNMTCTNMKIMRRTTEFMFFINKFKNFLSDLIVAKNKCENSLPNDITSCIARSNKIEASIKVMSEQSKVLENFYGELSKDTTDLEYQSCSNSVIDAISQKMRKEDKYLEDKLEDIFSKLISVEGNIITTVLELISNSIKNEIEPDHIKWIKEKISVKDKLASIQKTLTNYFKTITSIIALVVSLLFGTPSKLNLVVDIIDCFVEIGDKYVKFKDNKNGINFASMVFSVGKLVGKFMLFSSTLLFPDLFRIYSFVEAVKSVVELFQARRTLQKINQSCVLINEKSNSWSELTNLFSKYHSCKASYYTLTTSFTTESSLKEINFYLNNFDINLITFDEKIKLAKLCSDYPFYCHLTQVSKILGENEYEKVKLYVSAGHISDVALSTSDTQTKVLTSLGYVEIIPLNSIYSRKYSLMACRACTNDNIVANITFHGKSTVKPKIDYLNSNLLEFYNNIEKTTKTINVQVNNTKSESYEVTILTVKSIDEKIPVLSGFRSEMNLTTKFFISKLNPRRLKLDTSADTRFISEITGSKDLKANFQSTCDMCNQDLRNSCPEQQDNVTKKSFDYEIILPQNCITILKQDIGNQWHKSKNGDFDFLSLSTAYLKDWPGLNMKDCKKFSTFYDRILDHDKYNNVRLKNISDSEVNLEMYYDITAGKANPSIYSRYYIQIEYSKNDSEEDLNNINFNKGVESNYFMIQDEFIIFKGFKITFRLWKGYETKIQESIQTACKQCNLDLYYNPPEHKLFANKNKKTSTDFSYISSEDGKLHTNLKKKESYIDSDNESDDLEFY